MTRKELYNKIIDAAGGWADYASFRTPVIEACKYFQEEYGDNIPDNIVKYMMKRFAPHSVKP